MYHSVAWFAYKMRNFGITWERLCHADAGLEGYCENLRLIEVWRWRVMDWVEVEVRDRWGKRVIGSSEDILENVMISGD